MATMAVNLPIRDVPFRDLMAERLGLPVEVDNDGNVRRARRAARRRGAGGTDAVVLTIGTGIGGGLIVNGEPFRGAIGAGGYTTLAALTFRDFFQGGASYYGVSDVPRSRATPTSSNRAISTG